MSKLEELEASPDLFETRISQSELSEMEFNVLFLGTLCPNDFSKREKPSAAWLHAMSSEKIALIICEKPEWFETFNNTEKAQLMSKHFSVVKKMLFGDVGELDKDVLTHVVGAYALMGQRDDIIRTQEQCDLVCFEVAKNEGLVKSLRPVGRRLLFSWIKQSPLFLSEQSRSSQGLSEDIINQINSAYSLSTTVKDINSWILCLSKINRDIFVADYRSVYVSALGEDPEAEVLALLIIEDPSFRRYRESDHLPTKVHIDRLYVKLAEKYESVASLMYQHYDYNFAGLTRDLKFSLICRHRALFLLMINDSNLRDWDKYVLFYQTNAVALLYACKYEELAHYLLIVKDMAKMFVASQLESIVSAHPESSNISAYKSFGLLGDKHNLKDQDQAVAKVSSLY